MDSVEQKQSSVVTHENGHIGTVKPPLLPLQGTAVAGVTEGLAHDLNNLMSAIIGNAALIRSELAPGHRSHARLDAIEKAAERVAQITQSVAATAEAPRPKAEPVNLNTIVYHVLLAEEQRLAPRIRIVRYINPDLWKVSAAHAQIAQVTLELAKNAIEAILAKGRVYIGTRNADLTRESLPSGANLPPGQYVVLSIEDNGRGMTPEIRARIFEPAFTTKPGHPGMGLASAYDIVTHFGGHIAVSSIPGNGSAFRVYLPAFQVEKTAQPDLPGELPRGTETVLIVDDERMLLDVAQDLLERLGYRTLTAQNGLEAVEIARTHEGPIDLTLLDLVMPVMGGTEAYPLLKEARPDMRVIVTTGLDQEIVSDTLLSDGNSSVLLKPFRPAALAREIRKVLDAVPAIR